MSSPEDDRASGSLCSVVPMSSAWGPALLRSGAVDSYMKLSRPVHAQVSLIADQVDEPATAKTVDLLIALPKDEARFYEESNLVDVSSVPWELLQELL